MSGTTARKASGVPLRFHRPVMALIATGTAAICLGASAMPASADPVRNQEWWLNSIHVTSAWAASQGAGVTVAVLSDGVNTNAADLTGAVTAGAAPTAFPTATGQYLGELGTPIASLIAGRGHGPGGKSGVIGVAPKARILSIAVTLPPNDPQLAQSTVAASLPGAIAAGIRYAVNHGATVIDLPIDPGQADSSGTAGATAAAGGSAAERDAVNFALAHKVVLVAPAGDNEATGDARNYPAAYPGVIAVGAFGSSFTKAPWSSHQSYVTLTAPGAGVIAADNSGGYQALNSTNAASAVVTGVAALIRSRYPSLTPAEVRQVLITTTTYRRAGKPANGSGYGAVDAGQAMTAAATLAAPAGRRSAAGALPREVPAALPAPASSQGIGAQILRAAEISGGVLLLLLLLIAAYVLIGRRRPGGRPVLAAEWTQRHLQSRYPHAGGSDADRMLEFFASPAPPPLLEAPATRGDRYGPAPAGGNNWPTASHGVFAPAAGRELAGSSGRQPGAPAAGEPEVAGSSDGGWHSHGPASRAVSGRAPVTGTPPWEPASAPDGELPWTAASGRHSGGAAAIEGPRQLAPDERAWDAPAYNVPADAAAAVDPGEFGYPGDDSYDRFERPDHGDLEPSDRDTGYRDLSDREPSDHEPSARGFSSPAGASPSGPYPSPLFSGAPAGPPASAGYRSPTGSGGPADFGSRPDYWPPAGGNSPVGYGSFGGYDPGAGPRDQSREFDAAAEVKIAPSGLPVRQPRATRPPGAPPMSPSGSLWEPANRDASPPSEAADYQVDRYDASGQPTFGWEADSNGESR